LGLRPRRHDLEIDRLPTAAVASMRMAMSGRCG
jgi:hypothetical protein